MAWRRLKNTGDGGLTPLNQMQVVYFAKAGTDLNPGVNINSPKLTIAAAITAASAMTPSAANQIVVVGIDGGTYQEDFTIPSFVHLLAPHVSVDGDVDIEDVVIVRLRSAKNSSAGGSVFRKISGTSESTITLDALSVEGSSQEGVICDAGRIFLRASLILVDEGFAIKAKNGSSVAFDVGELILSNGARGIGTQVSGGSPNFFTGNILSVTDDGTCTLVKTKVDGDVVNIQGGSIMVDELYDLGLNSTLNAFVNESSGTRNADPTASVNITTNATATDTLRGGWANYSDLATQTVPFAVVGGAASVKVPNDALMAALTIDRKLPNGVARLYDPSAQQIDLSDLNVDDIFSFRFDLEVITSSNNQEVTLELFFGIGSGDEFSGVVARGSLKLAGSIKFFQTNNFAIFTQDIVDNPAELRISSDGNCTVIVNGYFMIASIIG